MGQCTGEIATSSRWLPDSSWGDSYVSPSGSGDNGTSADPAMAQAATNTSSGEHDVDAMFALLEENRGRIEMDLQGRENDTSWMSGNASQVATAQNVAAAAQSLKPTDPLPYTPRRWGRYSQLVLGQDLRGEPHVLWCGYYSPATAPSIKFGQRPQAPPDCSPDNGNIKAINNNKYWSRTIDLPINRYDVRMVCAWCQNRVIVFLFVICDTLRISNVCAFIPQVLGGLSCRYLHMG